jgi:hypothetical protein
MKHGDRVLWRRKRGTFQSLIKHTCRWKGRQLAMVLFDGNKRESKVPFRELQRIEQD